MNGVRYIVKLLGLKTPEGTIPLMALRGISDALLYGSERALRLSIEGASVRKGKIPGWLGKSLEFTIVGMSRGSTTLEIEAPTLAQSAPEQVRQQNLWYTLPNPEDTALSLLSKSILDVTSGQLESEYYDRGVLAALLSFEPPLRKYITELVVNSETRQRDNFKIGRVELEKISHMKAEIPEPCSVVLAGSFNLIEHTQERFQLTLEDGRNLPGKADLSLITHDLMRTLWGEKVTVKGTAQFSPSGKVRFVEAQTMKSFEPGDEVFENILEIKSPHHLLEEQKKKQQLRPPLKEIWGQWPGEESMDEILSKLREISVESV